MNSFIKFGFVWLCTSISFNSFAQDSSRLGKAIALPNKLFAVLDRKAERVESKLDKQTDKYLSKMQRQEKKLRRKIWKKDSLLAKQLFDGANGKYNELKQLKTGVVSKTSSVYSGHLDSLTTALNFLKNQKFNDNPALQKSLGQYQELQSKMNATDNVKKYITQRRELLKQQFEKLGMLKQLKQYRKQVYYYQQQVKQYKETFEDPNKIEARLMELVMKLPQFKSFFAKNSLLGSLFPLPDGDGGSGLASMQGLQTRALISQSISDRFGNGASVAQMLQQNISSAQGQLGQLKNKLNSYNSGSYGNTGEGDIPGFKANAQKTKSFLQRLEYGGNIQSQRARYFFPVTSDIALSLGYKINNKSSIGIGAAYKLGWGNNWNNIKLSHQGVGLRSYLDWKIKGSLYVSGGYEQNYMNMINSINQLQNYSAWQTSGLIGLSKKYSISKKMKGEMKLLWDFMSYQQIPRSQPILFRVGYSLK